MMERVSGRQVNHTRAQKRRRRKRWIRGGILLICCLAAFFFGKMIGRAQKRQEVFARQEQERLARLALEAAREAETAAGADQDAPDQGEAEDEAEDEACLLLVNRDHPLPEDYNPELVKLEDGVHQSAAVAYPHLCDMLRAGIREGLTFEICSAYRSVERQRELFEEDVRELTAAGMSYERAYEEVARETMPPGYSEHSTGLAFDIVSFGYQMLDARQEETSENKWLRAHCAEYGFILRYPKEKEDITRISYESWHFRYVGVAAAKEIMERGITLEEYLEGR